MNILVLAGGYSPERDVSLTSGSLIANTLAHNGHNVLLLDAYLGIPTLPDDILSLFTPKTDHSYTVPSVAPDLAALKKQSGNGEALLGPNVIKCARAADCVFTAMHGGMGEDGRLQATLDSYGIKYSGSGYTACLLAMDKELTKHLFAAGGVPTPQGMVYHVGSDTVDDVESQIGYPCVVKPCSCGSSVGVSIVETRDELISAIASASLYQDRLIVEKKFTGREFSLGILDGKPLPPIEIIPKQGFYDYANKYQGGATIEICPAQITPQQQQQMGEYALLAHNILGLSGYSRADFIMDEQGNMVCLEVNALPGMTPSSLLPREAAAAGISYSELCEKIISMAMDK